VKAATAIAHLERVWPTAAPSWREHHPRRASGARRDLRGLLGELLKLDHITGGLIVAPDGLVIAAELHAKFRPSRCRR